MINHTPRGKVLFLAPRLERWSGKGGGVRGWWGWEAFLRAERVFVQQLWAGDRSG